MNCEVREKVVKITGVSLIMFALVFSLSLIKNPSIMVIVFLITASMIIFPISYKGHMEVALEGVSGIAYHAQHTVCIRCGTVFLHMSDPINDWKDVVSPSKVVKLLKQLEVDCKSFEKEIEEAEHPAVKNEKKQLLNTLRVRIQVVKRGLNN